MPDEPTAYTSNDQLPADVQQLDTEAQDVWRYTFNNAMGGGTRRIPFAVREAWRAIARGWKLDPYGDGERWVKKAEGDE